MFTVGDVVADRFRLEAPLGEGGMGAVWRAEHIHLHMPVALKLMKTDPPPSAAQKRRFEREARIAAQIQSAHVVRMIDHGYEGDVPFIAMEMMAGEDLRARIERGPIPLAETAVIVRHVARALAQAHEHGLVHRDIKPDNIFITRDEEGRTIYKVLDFGVVKVKHDVETSFATADGALIGTPFYLSPEQAEGRSDIDHRSDLWALGVVAFECMTGTLPFYGESLGKLIVEIVTASPPTLSGSGVMVPPAVEAWLARALSKDKEGRFADARAMADAFDAAVGIRSTSTPPASTISLASSPTLSTGDTIEHTPYLDASASAPTVVTPPPEDEALSPVPTRPWTFTLVPVAALAVAGAVGAFVLLRADGPGSPRPAASAPLPVESAEAPSDAPTASASASTTPATEGTASSSATPPPRPPVVPVPPPTSTTAPPPAQAPAPPPPPPTAPPPSGKTPIRRTL